MMTRATLLDVLWAKVEPVLYITRQQFDANLEGWEIEALAVGGEPSFVVLTKGPELHFDSLGAGHRIPLKEIAARIDRLLDEHGYVLTRTPKDDRRQRKVNEMFGAVVVGEDEFDVHYRLERVPCPL